ncbi:hypothetical protein JXA40_10610 [bacterium]|nr:hypothetical protein [candidate division CSSED10-310 bacterium]
MNSKVSPGWMISVWLVMAVLAGQVSRSETITIMAANLTSGDSQNYEMPGIRIFQGLKPDIVLIQEFNYFGTLRDFVDLAFGMEYDYFVESGSESIPNGIVSRFPIVDAGQWPDDYSPDRDHAWAVIDVPGGIDLQVVSVHLKTGDAVTRDNQARAIRDHVEAYFDEGQYIAVGGDLNTVNRSEAAVTTFKSFLDADDHRPVDQQLNSYTNEARSRPYDWMMPNGLLDDRHANLMIGSSIYPDGLVFDSAVFEPLDEVIPVQYGDSHVSGMQHMAVMKAFRVGDPPPATPTPQVTPSPTHTGECPETGVEFWMPYQKFYPGFKCACTADICNADSGVLSGYPLFIVLGILDNYFFAPGFTGFDYFMNTYPPGESRLTVIAEFQWPSGAGSFDGAIWYGALTDPSMTAIHGRMGTFVFGWAE